MSGDAYGEHVQKKVLQVFKFLLISTVFPIIRLHRNVKYYKGQTNNIRVLYFPVKTYAHNTL